MNHENKNLQVSYFSHSFMVGQALHMQNNLKSSSVIIVFNCLGNYAYIYITNVRDKGDCILGNLLLDVDGKSLVNLKKSSLDKGTYMYVSF